MDFTMEGETLARRRDRRVSFAETTAVHVFDRDDSPGTAPKDDSNATLSPCFDSGGDESSRDTREDGDDDDEEEEDGLAVPPVRFPRDMTDSSPGSASAASVASNDGLSLVNNLIFSHTSSLIIQVLFPIHFWKEKSCFSVQCWLYAVVSYIIKTDLK
jgi:hypothetical protein